MSVVSIILSIIILGILVLVHEFGHFILAKKNGIFVKEFSIGFGPRIVSKVAKSGTRFSWKAIPFGGSCIMLGALEDDSEENDDERSFDKKSVWARMSVVLAGPVFNFFLAFVLAVIVIGSVGYDPAYITSVEEGSPAYEAGLKKGDVITNYNGTAIDFGREIYLEEFIHPITSDSKAINLVVKRDGKKQKVSITPSEYTYYQMGLSYYATDEPAKIMEVVEGSALEKAGLQEDDVITSINGVKIASGKELNEYFEKNSVGKEPVTITYSHRGGKEVSVEVKPTQKKSFSTGFSYNLSNKKASVGETIKYSFAELKYQIVSVFKSIGYLFSGKGSLDMLSGPVGIVDVVNTTYQISAPAGFLATLINILSIVILLSANLGVINLLPIPALDGGKFLLLIIEAIRRKPIPKKYEGVITTIGAVLIILLAIVVLVNDVTKFF